MESTPVSIEVFRAETSKFSHTQPLCRRGSLRIMAAITQESVITRSLRHRTLASVPPPIAPARCRQEILAFDEAPASVGP